MPTLSDILAVHEKLEPRHKRALNWFLDHEGQLVSWPEPLDDGTLLATRAKGIYKPQWSVYALSIRQTLGGPYPDHEVEQLPDGSWQYKYYQEILDVDEGAKAFTNRGLAECLKDAIPVGVLIQKVLKPRVLYLVQGLAFVNGWGDGYFDLSGILRAAEVREPTDRPLSGTATPGQIADTLAAIFDPRKIEDERRKVMRAVAERRGQQGFRRVLLDAYGAQCVATDYDAPDALEAAHIVPYRGPMTNHPSNGLLLRGDIHSLFDMGMLAVHESEQCFVLQSELRSTRYQSLHGKPIALPREGFEPPSREALRQHREWAGL